MKIQVVNALTAVKERGANEEGARGAPPPWRTIRSRVFAQKLISGHQSRCEWWEADHQFYSNYILMN